MKTATIIVPLMVLALFSTGALASHESPDDCKYTGPPAPTLGGTRVARFRVLTHNTYGQNDDHDDICSARLSSLGSQISGLQPIRTYPQPTRNRLFDIVGLQELHSDNTFSCFGDPATQRNFFLHLVQGGEPTFGAEVHEGDCFWCASRTDEYSLALQRAGGPTRGWVV